MKLGREKSQQKHLLSVTYTVKLSKDSRPFGVQPRHNSNNQKY